MSTKYLDYSGLSYFWSKLKTLFATKADKVTGATNGNFAGLDANGNLTDSGKKASDFKTVQTAVSDPTADGTGVSFIDSISQNANGEITPHKKTVANVAASTSGSGGSNGLMLATDKEKLDGISAGANKVEASNTNGNIKIDNVETAVYAHPTYDTAAAAAKKIGRDSTGHVVIGDDLAKGDVGLGNVDNTSDATKKTNFTGAIEKNNTGFVTGNDVHDALALKVNTSTLGQANGVATLDSTGKVPSSQLPSYVDDVIEVYPVSGATELSAGWLSKTQGGAALTPETGVIYVLMVDSTSYSANTQFRWAEGTPNGTYVKLNDGGVSAITNGEIDTIMNS
jgi:hypothetical protein